MGMLLSQFLNQYAYTDFHELNADWMIKTVMELINQVENFVSLNAIKYADPIQWNITKQYEKNTVVIDPLTGTAYISVQPVPMGVSLSNTDYWTVVFNLGSFVVRAAKNFSNRYEADTTTTATFASTQNDWLVWGDTLYEVIVPIINAGDQYVVDSNIRHITMEEVCDALAQAIDAVDTKVGDLDDLTTTDKSSIVNAIIEVVAELTQAKTAITTKPFINVKDFGAVGDGVTDDTQSFVDAIAEAATTNGTVIVPDGVYYLSSEPAVTDLNSGDNVNLLLGYDVEFTGAGAGDPASPVFNGKLLSPVCNKGNRMRGYSYKSYNKGVSPSGNGSVLQSVEWMADTSDDYINIIGSMANGSAIMSVSSTDGIIPGDGVVPVGAITGFPDGSTKQNTARVVSVDSSNNTIEIGFPSANPSAWAGIATASPWTGSTFNNEAFLIRHRFWNVTEFIGSLSGSGNRDRIGYGMNIVTSSNGNLSYGIELDMDFGASQVADGDIVHKGVYVLGFGSATPLTRAINVEHSASNWNVGLRISQSYHGIELNAAGGIVIENQFVDGSNGVSSPVLFGIKTDDVIDADLTARLPFIAAKQVVNGSVMQYFRRIDDVSPAGMFIDCRTADDSTRIFGVDIEGRIGAKGAYLDDMSATTGAITTLTGTDGTFSNSCNANIVNSGTCSTGRLQIIDTAFSTGSVTPTGYVTIYDTNGVAHNVPCT